MATHVVTGYDNAPCDREKCTGHYYWRNYCGAYVCDKCEDHKGLARCFCGWNHRSGEKIEGEECDYWGDESVDEDGWYRD